MQSERKRTYDSLKAEWLRVNTRCAKCHRRARIEVHHKCGRLGPLLTAQELWIALCGGCHRWVHANPDAARAANLLAQRGEWNNTRLIGKGTTR